LLVIDDPVKNQEEAASETIRQKHWEWWQATASTRLMPGGVAVLVMTRWNEDDLAGRLLSEHPDEWTVLNLPAVCETDNNTSELDVLGRRPGDALCRELYDEDALDRIRRQVGLYYWSAMYQQRPAPPEGFLFKRQNLRYWRQETRNILGADIRMLVLGHSDRERSYDLSTLPRFQTCDAALSEKTTADWTVVATWTVTPQGDLVLLDLERRHFEEQQVAHFLKAQNDKHNRPALWIERFGAGRNPLKILTRDGYPIRQIPAQAGSQTDKITRSFPAVALTEAHRLFLPSDRPEWLDDFESQLAAFPNAKNDDMVDVTSYAARLLGTVMSTGAASVKPPAVRARPITAGIMSEMF
jgi:predicted phage terminase large subunit-like protein